MELKLKELRKRAGYKSARLLADELGIPRGTIASWESGARDIPLDKAIEVCDLLDCTLDELAGRAPVDRVRYALVDLSDADAEKLADYAEYLKARGNHEG